MDVALMDVALMDVALMDVALMDVAGIQEIGTCPPAWDVYLKYCPGPFGTWLFPLLSAFTMPSSPLILITGANGFVGYAVLAGALKAGVSDDKHPYDSLLHGHAWCIFGV